jgi:hypothetical protein
MLSGGAAGKNWGDYFVSQLEPAPVSDNAVSHKASQTPRFIDGNP